MPSKVTNWIRKPFGIEVAEIPKDFTVCEQENLIELSSDEMLKSGFKKQLLLHFWIQQCREYSALSDHSCYRFFLINL